MTGEHALAAADDPLRPALAAFLPAAALLVTTRSAFWTHQNIQPDPLAALLVTLALALPPCA